MTPTKPEDALVELRERLRSRRVEHVGDPEMGPLTGALLNPDGPEAADAITTLLERAGKLEQLLWRAMDDASIAPDTWYAEARAALTGEAN